MIWTRVSRIGWVVRRELRLVVCSPVGQNGCLVSCGPSVEVQAKGIDRVFVYFLGGDEKGKRVISFNFFFFFLGNCALYFLREEKRVNVNGVVCVNNNKQVFSLYF